MVDKGHPPAQYPSAVRHVPFEMVDVLAPALGRTVRHTGTDAARRRVVDGDAVLEQPPKGRGYPCVACLRAATDTQDGANGGMRQASNN